MAAHNCQSDISLQLDSTDIITRHEVTFCNVIAHDPLRSPSVRQSVKKKITHRFKNEKLCGLSTCISLLFQRRAQTHVTFLFVLPRKASRASLCDAPEFVTLFAVREADGQAIRL